MLREKKGRIDDSLLSRLEEAITLHGGKEVRFLEWMIVLNFKMAVDQSPLLPMHWYSCVYMHKWSYTGYQLRGMRGSRLRDVHLNHSSRLIDSVPTLWSKWAPLMKRKYKLQPVLIRSYNRIIPTDYFLVDFVWNLYIYIYLFGQCEIVRIPFWIIRIYRIYFSLRFLIYLSLLLFSVSLISQRISRYDISTVQNQFRSSLERIILFSKFIFI